MRLFYGTGTYAWRDVRLFQSWPGLGDFFKLSQPPKSKRMDEEERRSKVQAGKEAVGIFI